MSLPTAFARAVGADNVLTAGSDVDRFTRDGRGDGGAGQSVVRPRSADEVVRVLREAIRAGLRVVPQGARTGLVGAGLGDAGSVILSLERLCRPPVIDAANRTADVDAGILLSTLNAAAEAHGLHFPIDLGADPSVGGMIAANTGGARFLRHGDVRRNLLAIEVVTAEPEPRILRLGAPLWKNNTGIDLKQLFVGSAGSLGIVTAATLALSPKPAATVSAMLALASPDIAIDLLGALEAEFGTLLSAFEGISAPALAAALAHVPRLRDPFGGQTPPYAVLIELSGGRALPEPLLQDMLVRALEPWVVRGAIIDAAVDHGPGLWAIRHAVPDGLRAAGRVVACDIALRRGDLMRFRHDVAERVAAVAPQLRLHDFGHVGDGGLHFNMVWPAAAGPYDTAIAERARDIVFTAVVEDYGGSFSAEHGIGPRNAAYYRRFVSEPERALAGAVQRVVAPAPIGRVDFGMDEVTG